MKSLTVILYNIRSTYNVGAILRTCDCLGVNSVIFSGYTPFIDKGLPHEQAKLKKEIHKTALGAEDLVTWNRFDDIHKAIKHFQGQGAKVYALEQCAWSESVVGPHEKFKYGLTLILGEEVNGIPEDVLSECDGALEIPMCGSKESFNVSVAAAIALWELRRDELNEDKYFRGY